jgi:hypothetical protein
MASEKKPSIYYDRGTIGSSDELDEYGVWVKGEPQDLSSGAESQESGELPDLDLPDMEDLQDFSASEDAGASFEELSEDNVSLDEDLELPDIDFEDDISGGDGGAEEEETITTDLEDSSMDLGESGDTDEPDVTGDMESFELSELPEPDFSDFIESDEEETEEGEMVSGNEAEDLGFVEVPMDVEEDAVIEDEPVQTLGGSGGRTEESPPKEAAAPSKDLSTQLLMRIADELASIRTELSTLKTELAGMKTESAPGETDDAQNHGFFDEEDDEKISLTGDELDNILNTADFTEESGADATEEAGDDFDVQEAEYNSSDPFQEITETPSEEAEAGDVPGDGSNDISLDDIDITKDLDLDLGLEEKDLDELGGEVSFEPADQGAADESPAERDVVLEEPVEFDITMNEGGDDFAAENPFEEIAPEEAQNEDAGEPLPDLDDNDNEELRQLREEGARPMTPAPEPEDTSFLEEDPMAFSEFENESLDLSNAVIDEPDLSGEIQENPLQEPSLDDISIDLDLGEEISFDEDIQKDTEDGIDGTGETESPEEEIELPVSEEIPEIEEEDLEDASAESADLAVIPEGFVVEAEDSPVPARYEGEEALLETGDLDMVDSDMDLDLEEPKEEALSPIQEIQDTQKDGEAIPSHLKQELKTVLSYMDQLLESLPDEKIEEFAKSEYFDTYKKLFKELGLV